MDTGRDDAVADLVSRAIGAAEICYALSVGEADLDDSVRKALQLVYSSLLEAAGAVSS